MNLIDAHTHTVLSSHAFSTIMENVEEAKNKGLKYYGVSDHAPALTGGQHIYAISNMRVIPQYIHGVRVLRGVELNIMNPEGDIDVDDESLSVVDYAIASIHSPVFGYQNIEATTQAYLRALRHPIVRVLGHIDDGKHMCDYRQVIEACVQNHVLIEVNNSSLKPDAFRLNAKENIKEILAICKELKCPIIMNSDAHFCLDVGNIEHSIEAITLANFPNELIVNYNEELLKEYFNV